MNETRANTKQGSFFHYQKYWEISEYDKKLPDFDQATWSEEWTEDEFLFRGMRHLQSLKPHGVVYKEGPDSLTGYSASEGVVNGLC